MYVYRLQEGGSSFYHQLTLAVNLTGRLVSDPDRACLFLVPITTTTTTLLDRLPTTLSHWQGDGRNHILIVEPTTSASPREQISRATLPGRYMIAQPHFTRAAFQAGFDLVLPVCGPLSANPVWADYPSLVPITRDYLLYFSGEQNVLKSSAVADTVMDSIEEDASVMSELKKLQQTSGGTEDRFLLSFSCEQGGKKAGNASVPFTDWRLCGEAEERLARQKEATFSLILPPADQDLVSTQLLQIRIHEALMVEKIYLGGGEYRLAADPYPKDTNHVTTYQIRILNFCSGPGVVLKCCCLLRACQVP